jgi:hypothetical protein
MLQEQTASADNGRCSTMYRLPAADVGRDFDLFAAGTQRSDNLICFMLDVNLITLVQKEVRRNFYADER